jgi:hypothetical protein
MDLALEIYENNLNTVKPQLKHTIVYADLLNNIANIYRHKRKTNDALKLYLESLKIRR